PSSNLFTLGRTLSDAAIRSGIRIALGTDSALTGEGDLIDEMRSTGLSPEDVYPLVTTEAASALRLSAGEGTIREGGAADLIAVRDTGQTPAQSLMEARPELAIVRGRIMLLSEAFARPRGFHRIQIEGQGSRYVRADVPRLHATAARVVGPEVRLAG